MKKVKRRDPGYSYADGQKFITKSVEEIFTIISEDNLWLGPESASGIGSSIEQTSEIVRLLPGILTELDIKTILDLPCGDFNWMKHVNLDGFDYTGADIVKSIIQKNQEKYHTENVVFKHMNLLEDEIGTYDLIFNRDCLVHFSFDDIQKSLKNFIQSGSKYLMTSTFTGETENTNIPTGGWRPLNFEISPFNFPPPVLILNEKCTEQDGVFEDKSLGVWEIKELKWH